MCVSYGPRLFVLLHEQDWARDTNEETCHHDINEDILKFQLIISLDFYNIMLSQSVMKFVKQ